MKKIWPVVLLLILVGLGIVFSRTGLPVNKEKEEQLAKITSFDACAAAGFLVTESYPPKCTTSDGRSFTQDIGNELEFKDVITISNPRPNQGISSPLQITGQAKGNWYFEATFPFELFDANKKSLGKGFATAKGEWMTEEFVPFDGKLVFETPRTKKGTLIITNANPSGLPENEKRLEIPVSFE